MKQKTSFSVLVALVVASLSFAAGPSKASERESLRKALQTVIDTTALKGARVSVQVRSLDDGSVVFARDADELLNPASNVKLFTTAAALGKLGPDYRFETDFLGEPEYKPTRDGKVKTLYVRGKGDPTITSERMTAIAAELIHAGVKEVADIVLDESYFDNEREAPGYDQETGDKAYLAPTGALSLNWNTIGVYVRPGENPGDVASVELEPPSDYFTITSELRTGTKTQRHYMVSTSLDKDGVHQKVEVKGVVPVDKGTWSAWKKIANPALYFGYTLKSFLQQRGVKVRGRIKQGIAPANAKLITTSQSETLDMILKRLNKHSSNFVAEQMIKTLGAELKGVPGSTMKGIEAVGDFLAEEVGIARGTYIMKNGSGLNDTNRFSSAQTNALLMHVARRFPTAPEFMSALPVAGKDGTLKYRFEGSDAVLKLRAKTGTLENVSALSGYVTSVAGERFVFSIMVNDFAGRASTVVQHIDALGAAVAASGSAAGPGRAIAAMTQPVAVLGPFEDLKRQMKTYVQLAQKADRRNAAFLRTSWRSEKDPAIRSVIAEALVQSDPKEAAHVRIFLDSALPSEEVYGRVRKAASELGLNLPVVPTLVELAASGQLEAVSRLLEFVKASAADDMASALLSEQLAVVANDAPHEFLFALHEVEERERPMVLDALVNGFVKAAQSDAPFWAVLKDAQGSQEQGLAEFAKSLEVSLSQRIAAARAPVVALPEKEGEPVAAPSPTENRQVVPGG